MTEKKIILLFYAQNDLILKIEQKTFFEKKSKFSKIFKVFWSHLAQKTVKIIYFEKSFWAIL